MITRKHAWGIWLIAAIFYAYQYILRVMPNIMVDEIIEKFQIDISTFGQLSGIYYIGYSLIHLPLGIMLDKYGPKKIIPIFISFIVAGSVLFNCSDSWIYPLLGRTLIGMGSSAAILGAFRIIAIGFSDAQYSRMMSFCVTIGLTGAVYAGGPLNHIKEIYGFEFISNSLIISGMILAISAYLIIPKQDLVITNTSIISKIRSILSDYRIMFICLFAGLMVGPLEGFADVWSTKFLKSIYHLDDETASYLPSLIFMGMCFGVPILSFIAEKTKKYFTTIVFSALIMCAGFILLLSGKLSIISLSVTFFTIGFLSSYQVIAIYKAITYSRIDTVSTTTAIVNMIIMIFGYIFHISISKIVAYTSKFYTMADSYIYGISIIPIGLFIAFIGFISLAIVEKKQFSKNISIIN